MYSRFKYAIVVFVIIVVAVIMQSLQEYIFYAKEVEHLWLYDWKWICPQLLVPGGIVQLLTSLCTQFFALWGVGALVVALMFGGVFAFGWKLQGRLGVKDRLASLWLFTLVFIMLCNEHTYFNLKGHFAMFAAMLAAYGYVRMQESRINLWMKVIAGFIIVAALYWAVGSATVVCVAVIAVFEFVKTRNWLSLTVSFVALLLMACLSVSARYFVSMEEALTPLQYYEWPSTYFFPMYAWASVPCVLLAGWFLGRTSIQRKVAVAVGIFCVVLAGIVLGRLYKMVHNERVYLLRQDEWNARNGDWDRLIKSHEGRGFSTAFISYLNLALAKKGQLVQRMGEFNPYILQSDDGKLFSPVLLANHELSRDALKLQSCVFMEWGSSALANAQKSAFEANLLTPGETDPIELQRLVVTNTIFDTEKTAEKYRRRLARTLFYNMDDTCVASKVKSLERTLPAEDSFYMKTQIGRMLRQIAMQKPVNDIVAQFYEAYLIQSQDTAAYRHWMEFKAFGK